MAAGLSFIWRSTDQIASGDFSQGYMWTIQPKTWGPNVPPAASHSSLVDMEPARPNLDVLESISASRPLGGRHMFTCWCHCATLRGMRSLSCSWVNRTGAVYIAPINL